MYLQFVLLLFLCRAIGKVYSEGKMLKGKKKVATWQEETVSILQVEIKPSSPLFIQYLVVGKS